MEITNEIIRGEALKLKEKYDKEYGEYVKNTGKIMHGATIMSDVLFKASFCESMSEIDSFIVYYSVCVKSMEEKNTPHGFLFSKNAMVELKKILQGYGDK
jgi:hypothetical protein